MTTTETLIKIADALGKKVSEIFFVWLSSVLDIKKEAKRISSAKFWNVYIVVLTVVSWISAKINAKNIREMVQMQFTIEKLKWQEEELRRQRFDKDKE